MDDSAADMIKLVKASSDAEGLEGSGYASLHKCDVMSIFMKRRFPFINDLILYYCPLFHRHFGIFFVSFVLIGMRMKIITKKLSKLDVRNAIIITRQYFSLAGSIYEMNLIIDFSRDPQGGGGGIGGFSRML